MTDADLELGVFARVFPTAPPAALAQTVRAHGFSLVQLNLVAVGLPTIPSAQEAGDLRQVGAAFRATRIGVWGVSGTYNMAHPDPEHRRSMTRRAVEFVTRVPDLGARYMTLCTGTRDPHDQWKAHPDNGTPQAWSDMMESFESLIEPAFENAVKLVVEPEPGNVVPDVDAALRLLDALGERADVVRFILDPANLVSGRLPGTWAATIDDAFTRLGLRTVCIHAKDVLPWGDRLQGAGGLDFEHIMRRRSELPAAVPVIIQDTSPEEVGRVAKLLRDAHGTA